MKSRYLVPLAVLGLGAAACGAQTAQLNVTPAANVVTASSPAQSGTSATCDAGAWTADDISLEGRPDRFDAGDRGATYVWHDSSGWHLRATDQTASAHVYSGRIVLSTGSFKDVQGVALERDDRFYVSGRTLYYQFVTYKAIDGIDFRVGDCSPAPGQTITFHARRDGALDSGRVIVGDQERHPEHDPFTAIRSL